MNNATILAERAKYLKKYNSGRSNLLVMILFTIINVVLCICKSTSYLLFSAQFPYFLAYEGMWWAGKMPDESYIEMFGAPKEEVAFLSSGAFYVMIAIAALSILIYFLCWLFSKKKPGWLTVALVLFILDTAVLVLTSLFYYVFDTSMIIDWAFHVWVIVYLISAINGASKLKKLPEIVGTEDAAPAEEAIEQVEEPAVARLNGEEESVDKE